MTEPAKKKRKVKPAENVNTSQIVSRNIKHTGKGKRSKPADVVTTTQQVVKTVTTHQPEINLQVNMLPACIQSEILEDPDDISAIQAGLMDHLDDSDDDLDAEDDLASIQADLLEQLDDSDDDDIVEIDSDGEEVDDDNGVDFQGLYKKWGVAGFDAMCDRLGGDQMLKLVMKHTKISAKDHAKLLVWNELNHKKCK